MIRLVLAAIDFEQVSRTAVEDLGEGFDGPRFARAGGPKEEEDARGPSGRTETGLIDLDARSDELQRVGLTDNLVRQQRDEIGGRGRRRC